MKEIGIILISHGHFAEYAMKSAEMIVGKQEKYKIVSVTDDKDLENTFKKVYIDNIKFNSLPSLRRT